MGRKRTRCHDPDSPDRIVQVRVETTAAEAERWTRAARAAGLSRQAWIRRLVEREIGPD